MKCTQCRGDFDGRKGQRFCSVACKLAAQVKPPNRTCEVCAARFHAPESATGRFCSPACRHIGHRKGKPRPCRLCGTSVIVRPSDEKFGFRVYCSLACSNRARRGLPQPKRAGWHPTNFRGYRKVTGKGYVMVRAPDDHPRPCVVSHGTKYVLEHRLVMERHLGRYLLKREVVHHRDENPANNRIGNLRLFASDAEHRRHHAALKR